MYTIHYDKVENVKKSRDYFVLNKNYGTDIFGYSWRDTCGKFTACEIYHVYPSMNKSVGLAFVHKLTLAVNWCPLNRDLLVIIYALSCIIYIIKCIFTEYFY